jgi:hypothetical protein
MASVHDLQAAVQWLAGSVNIRTYGFSGTGRLPIPSAEELNLLDALRRARVTSRADLEALVPAEGDLTASDYLITFAVRMVIHAARTGDPEPLTTALPLLAVDEEADFRDVLLALSVVEECGRRLGLDVDALLQSVAPLAGPRRRHTILRGFLSRDPGYRTTQVFGLAAFGEGETLRFDRP